MTAFEFELPAVQGIQAGQAYYVTMCPLNLLVKIFPDETPNAQPDPQSLLNRARIPEIARYISNNPRSYVLGAMTASVDAPVTFEPSSSQGAAARCGIVRIPLSARFRLHDGQHRCAALKAAVRANPKLAKETVSLVLLVDPGLKRSDQVFADLKRHERKLPRSLSILHDDRDEIALLTRRLIEKVQVFGESVEMVRTTISNRSRKLFTLSAIYQATKALLAEKGEESFENKLRDATAFWNEVAKQIPDWRKASQGQIAPAELRRQFVHAHGIALAALGRVGQRLLADFPKGWPRKLRALKTLDWSRSNSQMWEGRAMIAGRLSKSSACIVLTANAIKRQLGLTLTPEEMDREREYNRGK